MPTKHKLAYKVVRVKGNTLLSAVPSHPQAKYSFSRWTRPPARGHQFLFVFAKRANARDFARTKSNLSRVYRCKVINPTKFREGKTWGKHPFDVRDTATSVWPKGTLFADAVKLLKQKV
jgi:hypothetical protein